jgi:hypothetical protein
MGLLALSFLSSWLSHYSETMIMRGLLVCEPRRGWPCITQEILNHTRYSGAHIHACTARRCWVLFFTFFQLSGIELSPKSDQPAATEDHHGEEKIKKKRV